MTYKLLAAKFWLSVKLLTFGMLLVQLDIWSLGLGQGINLMTKFSWKTNFVSILLHLFVVTEGMLQLCCDQMFVLKLVSIFVTASAGWLHGTAKQGD